MILQNEIEEKSIKILERYPVSKAAFFGLKVDLEDEFNRPVDLITYNALSGAKPGFKNAVERDAHVFYIRTDTQYT